jgi:dTDP-4-amino-4,6-dideoxygalactose transaminase
MALWLCRSHSEGDIITTPFSYVATTSAILWERCKPVFVDIEPNTFTIDATKIESAITADTKAILAVHVFGYPCDAEAIDRIAKKHGLRVIYDAAHAFGVTYKGKSLLSYGDVSVCSFHATKLFHTIEGGSVIAGDREISKKLDLIKRFGHTGDEHHMLGINAKASEFQAAMGLCNLKYIERIIDARKSVSLLYDMLLAGVLQRPQVPNGIEYNYAYYPVVFENEAQLLRAMASLEKIGVYPRRYFYPSLNTLPYITETQKCPVSEYIAKRIICLPLYADIEAAIIWRTCEIIKGNERSL